MEGVALAFVAAGVVPCQTQIGAHRAGTEIANGNAGIAHEAGVALAFVTGHSLGGALAVQWTWLR